MGGARGILQACIARGGGVAISNSISSAAQAHRWSRHAGWMLLVLGLALSVLVYHLCVLQLRAEARERFEHESGEIHRMIASRLSSYSGLLRGLRGFLYARQDVTATQFSAYVGGLALPLRNPAVVSLGFAGHGAAPRLGSPPRPVGADREPYHVRLAPEPFDSALHAFGRAQGDLSPERLDELVQSGQLVSSGDVDAHQPGLPLAVRLALYRRGLPIDSAAEREAAYAGSVGLELSLLRLMQEAVPPEALSRMRIRLYNIGRSRDLAGHASGDGGRLLIDSVALQPGKEAPGGMQTGLVVEERLEFGGAMLALRVEGALETFAPAQIRAVPQVVLVVGLVLSLLMATTVQRLLRSGTGLARAVEERSRELRLKNAALDKEIRERDRVEREVMQTLTSERRRYGQELHDNLGQQLTAAGFLIEVLRAELEREGGQSEAARAAELATRISAAISRTRDLSHRLSPVVAMGGALTHALHGLAADTQARCGVDCQFQSDCSEEDTVRGDSQLEHHLFRMAQHAVAYALERGAGCIGIAMEKAPLAVTVTSKGLMAEADHDESLRIMAFRSRALGLAFSTTPAGQDGTDGVTLRFEEGAAR